MKYLLDTNVISEAMGKNPDPKVLLWIEDHLANCFISCITFGEIWKGIGLLPKGKRKQTLGKWAETLEQDFKNVCLPLDLTILKYWGTFYAGHLTKGLNLGLIDSLLAATALACDLTLVTRNTRDFPVEVPTLNPWI
jgi:predicted nucleic acid-binding protein